MPYVMVPVPEEMEQQIFTILGQILFREAMGDWDPEVLKDFVSETSEQERLLVHQLTESARRNLRMTRGQLAASLSMSEAELGAIIAELNRRAAERSQPWLVNAMLDPGHHDLPDTELIYMSEKVARMIGPATS